MAKLAGRQHGVVSAWQLLPLGLSREQLRVRVRRGRLHEIHRGVYAPGHRVLTPLGRLIAAVLAGGPGSVLSGPAAGWLWGMTRSLPSRTTVTTPTQRRSRDGIRFRHAALAPDEITTHDRIPVTGPSRTLLDIAATEPAHRLRRAYAEAIRLELPENLTVTDLLARYPGRPGTPALRSLLAESLPYVQTHSEFEDVFAQYLRDHDLPRPRFNAPLDLGDAVHTVDCLWPDARLILELDSAEFHADPLTMRADRTRDRRLTAAGYAVLRAMWRDVTADGDALACQLRALLAAAANRRRT